MTERPSSAEKIPNKQDSGVCVQAPVFLDRLYYVLYSIIHKEAIMDSTSKRLERFSSLTPSNWRKEAEERQANKEWLRYSQMIAIKMLDKMEELGLTQKMLAERMGCS